MSVVNQMLRDLDARRVTAPLPSLDAGVAPVRVRLRASRWPARGVAAVSVLAAAVAGALGTGAWTSADAGAPLHVVATATAPAPVTPVAPVAPVTPPAAASTSTAEPVPLAEPPRAAPRAAPAPAASARPVRLAIAAPTARSLLARPVSAPASAAVPAVAASAALAPVKHFALVDRVQAARDLWSAGQGDTAIALLREALAAPNPDAAGRGAAARELARLELLSRDAAGAIQTLDRHAAELRGDAQAWALRGNAAQRLGRHDDAVAAFESALRLQADDARSMLGAAVSLAAGGDTERARQWAERARRAGPVPAEVLAYLGRLGVSLER